MPDSSTIGDGVILINGPMAGHLIRVPDGVRQWNMVLPPSSLLPLLPWDPAGPILFPRDETVLYTIDRGIYPVGAETYEFRGGYTGPAVPHHDAFAEYVPTGLAEMGRLPWSEVPFTSLDLTEPVRSQYSGDLSKPCNAEADVFFSDRREIHAGCVCGWYTYGLLLDHRAQLLRAARRHELDAPRRLRLFREPIGLVWQGRGQVDDCYGGVSYDEERGLVHGVCRRCGWETERVEEYRIGPLRELCKEHTGPDGVRRVRNQLLASFGLSPAEPEDAGV